MKKLTNELADQRHETRNLEENRKEMEERMQGIRKRMMERDDECKEEVRKNKGEATELERRLRKKVEELEEDLKMRAQISTSENQTRLEKGSAVVYGRQLATCEPDERNGKLKIRYGDKIVAITSEQVEVVNGNNARIAKSTGNLLSANGEGKRNDEINGRDSSCQEKCRKAEEDTKRAWDAFEKVKKESLKQQRKSTRIRKGKIKTR